MDGKASQAVSGLPNGKYSVKAAVSSSFNGKVQLFANEGRTSVLSGNPKIYETSGIVFNGTLELGLEVDASGSPTIDMDNFELTYCGNDPGRIYEDNERHARGSESRYARHGFRCG